VHTVELLVLLEHEELAEGHAQYTHWPHVTMGKKSVTPSRFALLTILITVIVNIYNGH